MYSNELLSKNLQKLLYNSSYDIKELSTILIQNYGVSMGEKQLNKYINGTTDSYMGSDSLYALADILGVSLDSLVGLCDLFDYYIPDGNTYKNNKFNLNADTRHKLENVKNENEINVLNQLLSKTNVIEIFAMELENVSLQCKDITDTDKINDIIFVSSCKVQRQIDKLFTKMAKSYLKNKK